MQVTYTHASTSSLEDATTRFFAAVKDLQALGRVIYDADSVNQDLRSVVNNIVMSLPTEMAQASGCLDLTLERIKDYKFLIADDMSELSDLPDDDEPEQEAAVPPQVSATPVTPPPKKNFSFGLAPSPSPPPAQKSPGGSGITIKLPALGSPRRPSPPSSRVMSTPHRRLAKAIPVRETCYREIPDGPSPQDTPKRPAQAFRGPLTPAQAQAQSSSEQVQYPRAMEGYRIIAPSPALASFSPASAPSTGADQAKYPLAMGGYRIIAPAPASTPRLDKGKKRMRDDDDDDDDSLAHPEPDTAAQPYQGASGSIPPKLARLDDKLRSVKRKLTEWPAVVKRSAATWQTGGSAVASTSTAPATAPGPSRPRYSWVDDEPSPSRPSASSAHSPASGSSAAPATVAAEADLSDEDAEGVRNLLLFSRGVSVSSASSSSASSSSSSSQKRRKASTSPKASAVVKGKAKVSPKGKAGAKGKGKERAV